MKMLFISLALALTSTQLIAAPSEYEYPELQVTPLASARLQIEGAKEGTFNVGPFLPFQISALATLSAGIIQSGNVDKSKDEKENSPTVGIIVGGSWLALTTAMSRYYHPYTAALNEVKALPNATKRDQLTRERLAEEAIDEAESLGNRLMWISFVTNFAANMYMITNSEKETLAGPASGIGLITAFAPMLFKHPWQKVAKEQREYKKKIYAPIAINSIMVEPVTNRLFYGPMVTFSF